MTRDDELLLLEVLREQLQELRRRRAEYEREQHESAITEVLASRWGYPPQVLQRPRRRRE